MIGYTMSDELLSRFKTRRSLLNRLKVDDNEEAWREFHDLYGRLIFGYCLHFGIGYSEAEDIVQEVCLKVFRHIHSFDYSPNRGRFRGWLKTITQNTVIDYIRRRQNRLKGSSDYRTLCELQWEEAGQSADEVWQQEWEKALYEAALERVRGRVDEETYRIFHLYVLDAGSAKDVADETHLDANAIYAVKHRMLKYLREEVERIINAQ